VAPAFRSYASLLMARAFAHRNVTYLNITPAPHTLAIVRAQGYTQYCKGIFVAVPALRFSSRRAQVTSAADRRAMPADIEPFERELLYRHAGLGCISISCAEGERASPFVFRRRLVKGAIPCAQLIYCRDIVEFVRCAGAIGRFLALRGCPLVLVDANGPIAGLPGRYFEGRMPKYFKGPDRPRLGDLAYTETAMFGM
jgi:hypothetical protein